MSRFFFVCFWLAVLNFAKPVSAQIDAQQAASDAAELGRMHDQFRNNQYRQMLDKSFFGSDYDEKVAGYRQHLKQLKAFEQNDVGQIRQLLDSIASRYGNDQASVRQTFQNSSAAISGDPAYWWAELKKIADSPTVTRQRIADKLNEMGKTGGQTAQGYDRMTVAESYARAKTWLELAVQYQPDHAEAKNALAKIDSEMESHLAADEQSIDQAEFPAHARTFQGDAAAMGKIAFDYMKNRNVGVDGELLKVRIAGDWKPYDTVLNVTINWGLPVEAAYSMADDPDTAQVIAMKLISRSDQPEAPFQRHVITGDRLVRVKNLNDSGGKSANWLLRFPLALCMVALGLVAMAPVAQQKLPAIGEKLIRLQPFEPIIGVVTLAIGLLALIFNLFSPLKDLLPQLVAIVLGVTLGLDLLVRKRAASQTPASTGTKHIGESQDLADKARLAMDKAGDVAGKAIDNAQNLLIENQDKFRKLSDLKIPLAIGCLVLGIVHLVAGGKWLF